jgi:hypothetical protein
MTNQSIDARTAGDGRLQEPKRLQRSLPSWLNEKTRTQLLGSFEALEELDIVPVSDTEKRRRLAADAAAYDRNPKTLVHVRLVQNSFSVMRF